MKTPEKYIATWFYKESSEEASFYPQAGRRGDSPLVHSIYLQIQVPFFATFRHYNPDARLLFFTNVEELPEFLNQLFLQLEVEVIRLPYLCAPPEGWYEAWRNQFYVYDILRYMQQRMQPDDCLLICDADCLCTTSLKPLFDEVSQTGSALYELKTEPEEKMHGISLGEMTALYEACYNEEASKPIYYYGGEFVAFRGDAVARINEAYQQLWNYNLLLFKKELPKLNEEALFLSVLVERLNLRNNIANRYMKRMWTSPQFNNMKKGDERLSVWHLPYEKKRGLYYLYKRLLKSPFIEDEQTFWKKAAFYTGVPTVSMGKKWKDWQTALLLKFKS